MSYQTSALLLAAAILALTVVAPSARAASDVKAPGGTSESVGLAELLKAVTEAPAPQRSALVGAAVAARPRVADEMVAALITAFPVDAPAFTATVVKAVLALPVDNSVKGPLLAAIAVRALDAASRIPPAAVPDLVATINGVKAALATVPPELLAFVEPYLEPITSLPVAPVGSRADRPAFRIPPTQTILSEDAP